jgi:hypothetical protein
VVRTMAEKGEVYRGQELIADVEYAVIAVNAE